MLELLNSVSMAKRMANMALHSEGFGKRQETNKKKAGIEPNGNKDIKVVAKGKTTVKGVKSGGKKSTGAAGKKTERKPKKVAPAA